MYRSRHSRAGGNPCGATAAAQHGLPGARARRWLLALALALAGAAPLALAGNQKEEALADSVRLALSNAIKDATPPTPSFRNPSDEARYRNWLDTMSYRLQRKLADQQTRSEFLATVWYEARRAGLDPGMVLGLIQVESAYRKYAVSIVGARGYMQVMPFWTNVIGDRNRSALFNMQTNLRYGCSILRMYLDMEAGNVYLALGRYNGSRGKPEYPNAVLAAWNHWK